MIDVHSHIIPNVDDGSSSVNETFKMIEEARKIGFTDIILTSHKSTKKDNLAKVKKDIENVGGKIAGVVINKVPVNVAKYESSYYYGSTAISNTPRKKEPEREFYTNDSSRITKAKKEDILNQLDEFLKDK